MDIANVLEFDLAGQCMKLFLLLGLCLMQILLTQPTQQKKKKKSNTRNYQKIKKKKGRGGGWGQC